LDVDNLPLLGLTLFYIGTSQPKPLKRHYAFNFFSSQGTLAFNFFSSQGTLAFHKIPGDTLILFFVFTKGNFLVKTSIQHELFVVAYSKVTGSQIVVELLSNMDTKKTQQQQKITKLCTLKYNMNF